MPLRIVITKVRGDIKRDIEAIGGDMAVAATRAVHGAGDAVKEAGKFNIMRAGFPLRWQNALHVKHYPKGGRPSINAASFVYHKIPYAGVFETGPTTIFAASGKYMWIPIAKNLPTRIGGHRWTPEKFSREYGKLTFVQPPGRKPLLFRKGRTGFPPVPVFIGVRQATVRDRFQIQEIADDARARLGASYFDHLNRIRGSDDG